MEILDYAVTSMTHSDHYVPQNSERVTVYLYVNM